jgi:flagellar assembly protein FliH
LSKSSSPYHRFIPREEVQAVAAWTFEPMDGKGLPASEATEDEGPQAPTPEQIEALREQAYAEGMEHGRQAGEQAIRAALEAPLRQQAQEQAQRLATLLRNTQTQLDQLEDALAAQVLELACDLARQVVRRELVQSLEPLKTVVHEALALAVQDGQPATVRLNPADLSLLQDDIGEALGAQKIKLVPDAAITPGGCAVESVQGTVDGTVEKRWARAVANLGLQVGWNPGDQADV